MLKELLRWTVLLVVAMTVAAVRAGAADDPQDLKWADLVPSGIAAEKDRTFFAGSKKLSEAGNAPAPPAEGKFMSLKRLQPGGDKPPAVVTELDGRRVRIGGYVVPLDFEQTSIKEFLLVPFVGACIHVPPPPANQIIYVKAEQPFEVNGPFDPVTVVGKLKTETSFTGLADAGYSLAAETVVPIQQ